MEFKEASLSSKMPERWKKWIHPVWPSPVEVPQIISAEQRCFRDMTFFSADSGNIENISAVFEEISAVSESALNQPCSALIFLTLNIFVLRAVQSWISDVQRFSGNERHWIRTETFLNQSWSALNVSETSTRVAKNMCKSFVRIIESRILSFKAALKRQLTKATHAFN